MMLAEKGEIGVMIKGKCCTFTPNNMASDGTITKDLQ
jgi:hypothetical protein